MNKIPVKKIITISSVVVFVLILISGFYIVDSKEEAVILRFGKYVKSVNTAGPKWHIPLIEQRYKVNVSEINRLEFGFRTTAEGSSKNSPKYQDAPHESLMLTGDENLVNIETIIQYKIIDPEKYLFCVDDPIGTLRVVAESTIRRGVANHTLDEVLTDNKFAIQQEIKDDIQKICNMYNIGISITAVQLQDVNPPTEVESAFKDVAGAREDKNSYINEANSYRNEIIPNARGNAAEMKNKAEAYKQARIEEAKGDVANFVQILEKYQQGKQVTRTRMYLETLEEILPGIEKYILSEKGDTVKFLPLGDNTVIPAKEGN